VALNDDDVIRRDVIRRLMSHFTVLKPEIASLYGIDFDDYFAGSLRALEEMSGDDLVTLAPDRITIRPLGRLLVRNIAMAFDAHLASGQGSFSRTV
ncbi:MAG: coproporphyrinogen III oxidase, partial [Myxococcota bacterium]